ncbi:MAG TPA: aldo/keto reductase [Aestuariivirga sp.]|nr:aldo/keto reductase [Aestuariivirga sp.]
MVTQAKTVQLPDGRTIPALGLGTWRMGENRGARPAEVAALRAGIDLGISVIDTAEMYGDGGAEDVVAEAIAGKRDDIFLVSKVMPQNASFKGTVAACEKSLKRLKTGHIDLYLLHWRGGHPLADTVAAFERLRAEGKIGQWGVSNFDVADMAELALVENGPRCAANQVMYHLGERGIEWQLLPEAQRARMPVMAYCPLGQGELTRNAVVVWLAKKHAVAASAVALAFLLAKPGVQAIPKSAHAGRVREFAAALNVKFDDDDLSMLDREFPPPTRKTPLAMT